MVRDLDGAVVITDDDPAPKVTIRPVHKRVSEGQSAQWRVTLSRPTNFFLGVVLEGLRGPRGTKSVHANDLGARWLAANARCPGPRANLSRCRFSTFEALPEGRRSAVVSVPVARDGRAEPREALTLRIQVDGRMRAHKVSTVFVRRSR